ncbi:putative quinol monooxygenase [Kiloniella sp. b19]|uniref:putative quinol monooxygenase n=1 Tax=Kiloniella sp. GXU_MW_B19 TaxID=3141326 RepID=UPI0031D38B98
MKKLWISAGIRLAEGADVAEAREGLSLLVGQTRGEEGCLLFEIHQNIEDTERFTLWECWTGEDALKAHFEAEHTRAYLDRNLTTIEYIDRLGGDLGSTERQV